MQQEDLTERFTCTLNSDDAEASQHESLPSSPTSPLMMNPNLLQSQTTLVGSTENMLDDHPSSRLVEVPFRIFHFLQYWCTYKE